MSPSSPGTTKSEFIRRLDELETLEERRSQRSGQPMRRRIFPDDKQELRWSRFKELGIHFWGSFRVHSGFSCGYIGTPEKARSPAAQLVSAVEAS